MIVGLTNFLKKHSFILQILTQDNKRISRQYARTLEGFGANEIAKYVIQGIRGLSIDIAKSVNYLFQIMILKIQTSLVIVHCLRVLDLTLLNLMGIKYKLVSFLFKIYRKSLPCGGSFVF